MEDTDRRTAALLSLVTNAVQRDLVTWMLAGCDALEQTDFGDLEPLALSLLVSSQ